MKLLNFACGLCVADLYEYNFVDTILVRDVPEGQQRIPGYFSTPIYVVDDSQHLELQQVAAHLSKQLSGFVLHHVTKFTICIAQYRPLHGSSYIATPQWLAKKRAIVNIKNTSDSKCFVWSVLAALHPGAINPNRLSNYKPHENTGTLPASPFPWP